MRQKDALSNMHIFSKPKPDTTNSILKSAAIVGFITLLSRITGLFQSRMLACYLGVGMAFDAFSVAYRIPNLLRRFTAEGTMTSAFLPTVSEVESDRGEDAARIMVARFMGTLALLLALLCGIGMLGMGLLVGLQLLGRIPGETWGAQAIELFRILLGQSEAPAMVRVTTLLARLMFPYLALVSLTAGLSAVLNLRGRFGLPASISTFWNLAFLAMGYAAFKWGPATWKEPVHATFVFAVAVLFGGIVQVAVLWPSFRRLGFEIHWGLFFKDADVRRAFRRMLPGVLGTGIHPINVLISMCIASHLAMGAQGVLLNSNMMGEMVLGLFSASLATVSLPTMSRLVDQGDTPGLRRALADALRATALLAIPSSVGLAVLAHPIIAIIFRTGRFDAEAVRWTATTLAFQSVGLLFIATSRISAQCLYALKDYRGPAYAALLGMSANILLSIALMRPLGTGGIALANGLSSLVGLGYLCLRIKKRLVQPPFQAVWRGWLVMGFAATAMGCMSWLGSRLLHLGAFHGTWGTSLRLFPLMGASALFYFAILTALRVQEARAFCDMARRKLLRR